MPAKGRPSPMLTSFSAIFWLLLFSGGFAIAGILYSRHDRGSLEDYIVARSSQSTNATILTLLASNMGACILFAPAQAATWSCPAGVFGYEDRKSAVLGKELAVRVDLGGHGA